MVCHCWNTEWQILPTKLDKWYDFNITYDFEHISVHKQGKMQTNFIYNFAAKHIVSTSIRWNLKNNLNMLKC